MHGAVPDGGAASDDATGHAGSGAGQRGGIPTPATVQQLRRRVYGRDPDPEDVARLRAAVAEQEAAAQREAAAPLTDRPQAPRRVRSALPLVAAAVLLFGAAAGAVVALLPQPVPTASAAALGTGLSAATTARAVFDRAQLPADRPRASLGGALVPSTARHLIDFESVALFGVRDRYGDVCLLSAGSEYVAACATPEAFRDAGVTLTWSAPALAIAPGSDQQRFYAFPYVATWRPDGRVTVASAER